MFTNRDRTGNRTDELSRSENAVSPHRIQLAKSVLLINLPDITGGRISATVLNTTMHPMEPIFTREVV